MMPVYPDSDSFSRFEYGIKSQTTKEKYVKRLELFFDFYKIEGNNIQEQSENFLKAIKNGKNTQKLTDLIIKYMSYHLNRLFSNSFISWLCYRTFGIK